MLRWKAYVAAAVAGALAVAGLYWAGWSARGARDAAAAAEKKAAVAREVETIENDVRSIEDDGLAGRLSRGR